MKSTMACALALTLSAALAPASAEGVLQPGAWSGTGRYYDVDLAGLCPRPRFELRIEPSLAISGTVEGVPFLSSAPNADDDGVWNYVARLPRPICSSIDADRLTLAILVTRASPHVIAGDFHIKKRPGFDLGMHAGEFNLRQTGDRTAGVAVDRGPRRQPSRVGVEVLSDLP